MLSKSVSIWSMGSCHKHLQFRPVRGLDCIESCSYPTGLRIHLCQYPDRRHFQHLPCPNSSVLYCLSKRNCHKHPNVVIVLIQLICIRYMWTVVISVNSIGIHVILASIHYRWRTPDQNMTAAGKYPYRNEVRCSLNPHLDTRWNPSPSRIKYHCQPSTIRRQSTVQQPSSNI